MKKILLATASMAFLIAASCQNRENNTPEEGENVLAQNNMVENQAVKTNSQSEGKTIHLTAAEFKQKVMDYETNSTTWVFEGDKPCIVDFYADWCRPCKIVAPILEDLAKEYAGKINIYKVDTQKEQELAAMFGIQSIPHFYCVPWKATPK